MCSIGEDDFGDEGGIHSMVKQTPSLEHVLQGTCKKCSQQGLVIKLGFREPECSECFLVYVRHKFRATLGSSKVLPKGAKLLLLFDGSRESVVLLDMMYYAQAQNNFKRLHCTTRVLYIDDQLMEDDISQRKARVQSITNLLSQFNTFEKFIMRFSAAPTKPISFDHIDEYWVQADDHYDQDIQLDINAIRSLTARQDFVSNQRNRLIAAACAHLECDFVFLPDISTHLATQLLTNIALGRGGSVALNVSLVDDRLSGLKLVRPIKDLNEMEVRMYLRVRDLQPVRYDEYGDHFGDSASLQNLTKAFVGNLQKNFSSTVSTIFRTGNKIAPIWQNEQQMHDLNARNDPIPHTCAFCHSSLDYFESNTILATEFSRIVSESGTALVNCANTESAARKNIRSDEEETLNKYFCHGCRNILNECPNKNLMI